MQFSEVARIVQPKYENDRDFKLLHAFQDELLDLKQWFGFSRNASYGIYSHEVQDSARTLYDMHQIIRNKLAYEANPEVNYGNRWEKGKITIDFDEPHQSDKENELIKIS